MPWTLTSSQELNDGNNGDGDGDGNSDGAADAPRREGESEPLVLPTTKAKES